MPGANVDCGGPLWTKNQLLQLHLPWCPTVAVALGLLYTLKHFQVKSSTTVPLPGSQKRTTEAFLGVCVCAKGVLTTLATRPARGVFRGELALERTTNHLYRQHGAGTSDHRNLSFPFLLGEREGLSCERSDFLAHTNTYVNLVKQLSSFSKQLFPEQLFL